MRYKKEVGADYAPDLAEQAKAKGEAVLQEVKKSAPESYNDIKEAVNKFAEENNLPFNF